MNWVDIDKDQYDEFKEKGWSDFIIGQFERQFLNRFESKYYKKIEIEPFLDAMESFSDSRYQELHEILNPGTITNIHKLYESGHATPVEIVLFYLQRAIEFNHLNSIISLNPDLLKIVEDLGPYDHSKPLYGIPVLLKDNIGTGDKMPNTAGSVYLKDSYLERDAFIVKQLREAGAIIFGKANLSEWANFMTERSSNGYTALGGQTSNPYGLFDVGGSSSGSAVAVAVNLVPVAIGSETAGSLVYPASQNNVVTIKPTAGLVSRDLIIPISGTQDTAGPMTNTVDDAMTVLEVISGVDHEDEITKRQMGQDKESLEYDKVRLGFINNKETNEAFRPHELSCFDKVFRTLQQRNIKCGTVTLDSDVFELNMYDVLLYEFKRDLNAYLSHEAVKTSGSLSDIIAFNKKDTEHCCHFGQSIFEKSEGLEMEYDDYKALVEKNIGQASQALDKAFEEYDVLVSVSNAATTPYACAGYPVINIPVLFSEDGEPVGITLIGRQFQEHTLVALGKVIEDEVRGRKLPDICE